jgi:hypothetical protein
MTPFKLWGRVAVFSVFAFLLFGKTAFADSTTVLAVTHDPSLDDEFFFIDAVGGPVVPDWEEQSFSLSHPLADVSISADINAFEQTFPFTVWLTNSIGPTTGSANVIASANFNGSFSHQIQSPLLFSDLNLAAGTYYLVADTLPFGVGGRWFAGDLTTATDGVTLGPDLQALGIGCAQNLSQCPNFDLALPPASTWSFGGVSSASNLLGLDLTITASVPEPEPVVLTAIGFILFFVLRRYRKKKS